MSDIKKRIIFISNTTYPNDNLGGGSVVIYRHLKRFQLAGHKILIINVSNKFLKEQQENGEFEVVNLTKKWWFPPLRKKTSILTRLRIFLHTKTALAKIRFDENEDLILGIFGEFCNLLILNIYNFSNIKYYLFYHDDTLFNRYAKDNILNKSHINMVMNYVEHIFPVSDSLTDVLHANGFQRASTLYPIPNGYYGDFRNRSNLNNEQLHFCISGMIWQVHFNLINRLAKCLSKNGEELVFISNFNENFQQCLNKQINFVNRFETLNQLFHYMISNIDVLIVFYSFDLNHEPRMLSSFPSKLLEYCHLGIPILIIAPPESTLGKWALENKWLSYLDNDYTNSIISMAAKFKNETFWQKCKRQSLHTASTQFNPDYIHKQLEDYLS